MKNIIWKTQKNNIVITSIYDPTGDISSEEHAYNMISKNESMSNWTTIAYDIEESPDSKWFDAFMWNEDTGALDVDISKGKELVKEKLRRKRTKLLENLDLDFMKALETGSKTIDIVTEKKRLRDITNHEDLINATTLEDLEKAINLIP